MTFLTFTSYYDGATQKYVDCELIANSLVTKGTTWWHWKNDTGKDVTIEYSIYNKRTDSSSDNSYGTFLYMHTSRSNFLQSTEIKSVQSSSGKTVTGTYTIPAGKWLFYFNQNNATSKVTILFVN